MKQSQVFLIAAAMGLTPIAFSYGLKPEASIPYLFGFPVEGTNATHIFRAVMGLYLAQVVFWIAGAIKQPLRVPALWSVVIFMLGLAMGRVLSVIVDGIPNILLLVYLGLEIGFGLVAGLLIRKAQSSEHNSGS